MALPGCMAPDGADPCEAYTAMRRLVEKMADAIDHGSIDSPEIGNPNEGEPPFKWHEEWRHHARQALQQS